MWKPLSPLQPSRFILFPPKYYGLNEGMKRENRHAIHEHQIEPEYTRHLMNSKCLQAAHAHENLQQWPSCQTLVQLSGHMPGSRMVWRTEGDAVHFEQRNVLNGCQKSTRKEQNSGYVDVNAIPDPDAEAKQAACFQEISLCVTHFI